MMSSPSSSVPTPPAAEDPGSESAPGSSATRPPRAPSSLSSSSLDSHSSSFFADIDASPATAPGASPRGGRRPLDAPEPLATSSIATSAPASTGSSKSSLGGRAHGVSGSSIFILACAGAGGKDAVIDGGGGRIVDAGVAGKVDDEGGGRRRLAGVGEGGAATHRLVGLVVAEVLLVPDDVLALMLGGVARLRWHVHVGHGARRWRWRRGFSAGVGARNWGAWW